MQAIAQAALGKRARYYHSQIDMDLLATGKEYVELNDGSETIFLSTKGQNAEDASTELVKFLKYVGAELAESTKDFEDEFIEQLQHAVSDIKLSRRMGERYMLTELLMQDERRAGRAEGRIEGLKRSILVLLDGYGTISQELKNKIEHEMVPERVEQWIKLAAKVDSIDQFIKEM